MPPRKSLLCRQGWMAQCVNLSPTRCTAPEVQSQQASGQMEGNFAALVMMKARHVCAQAHLLKAGVLSRLQAGPAQPIPAQAQARLE
jgi:hypothetical protein